MPRRRFQPPSLPPGGRGSGSPAWPRAGLRRLLCAAAAMLATGAGLAATGADAPSPTPPAAHDALPPLRAAVFEVRDSASQLTGAARILERAGAVVAPLALDDPPPSAASTPLLVFGSYSSLDPAYRRYVVRHAAALQRYVEEGGVLLQGMQRRDHEPAPPFLPAGLRAERGATSYLTFAAERGHPLLDGLANRPPPSTGWALRGHPLRAVGWDAFREQSGFEALVWGDTQIPGGQALLLEGRHGRGRFLLSALVLDRLYRADGSRGVGLAFEADALRFAANLLRHVRAVAAGTAPEPRPTDATLPPPRPRLDGAWTLAVLPDPQIYAHSFPQHFAAQTRWIREQREAWRIPFAVVLGDLVHLGSEQEWRHAREALSGLDGAVPFALLPGNHDYLRGRPLAERATRLSEFFPVAEVRGRASFGGVYEPGRIDNSYHLFEAGGRGWLVLALEYLPRDGVVTWAAGVLARHPDRAAIVVTHAYLDETDRRLDGPVEPEDSPHLGIPPGTADGEDLWRRLVAPHPNVVLVLSGHITGSGSGWLVSRAPDGRRVAQMMANYQMRPEGGEGYLRLLEFGADGRQVRVRTYSPVLGRELTLPRHDFDFDLDLGGVQTAPR